MYDFKIGVRYNVQFLGPAILGSGLRNALLVGIVDYRVASNESNVTTTHAQLISYLPATVSRDPTKLSYLLFETESGNRSAFAYPWVVETSIEIAQNKTLTVSIVGASADDAQKVKEVLSLAGWKNISISVS